MVGKGFVQGRRQALGCSKELRGRDNGSFLGWFGGTDQGGPSCVKEVAEVDASVSERVP